MHEVERALAVMAQLGFSEGDPRPHLRIALEAGEPVGGRVVVHPGAAVPARTLAPSRWARCVESLACHGYDVVVTGSDEERDVCAVVAEFSTVRRSSSHDPTCAAWPECWRAPRSS